MHTLTRLALTAALTAAAAAAQAAPTPSFFEAAGAGAAAITPTRDAFRLAIGGGNAPAANGSFGSVRREINWDGVPNTFADPNLLPANFFNTTSPRGAVFSTPGSGFLVSANVGLAPVLFGFPNDFLAFSEQRLFTAVNSNITQIDFFVAGTNAAASTTAFGAIFTDVETAGGTKIDFFDETGAQFLSRDVGVTGNQGLAFLGVQVTGGSISRVRITSGLNTISANGVIANQDDVVVMDDFIYAEPIRLNATVPEPSSMALAGLALAGLLAQARRGRSAG